MWDFILPNEEQQEALHVSTRSKNTTKATHPSQQQKNLITTKHKTVSKKVYFKGYTNKSRYFRYSIYI